MHAGASVFTGEADAKQYWLKCDALEKRHEISGERIRALYGHSIPQRIAKTPAKPPEVLYHGTVRRFIPSIKENGLLPRSRQYVHLSADTETALQVGKRRDDEPVLLRVEALKVWENGIRFT